jgi:phage gp46-like protein
MSDIALTWDPDLFAGDFTLTGGQDSDYVTDEGLRTAMVLSLFCDRLAENTDILPDAPNDRRGWWADSNPVVSDDLFGSRLWLLDREKNTPDVLSRAKVYASEALQWLIDDRVADSISVVSSYLTDARGRATGYSVAIMVLRPKQNPITFRFDRVWVTEAGRK